MMRLPGKADQIAKAEALQTWTADRGRLVFRQPMLASLALNLEIVPVVDARMPTAATDGHAIYVNPYFLQTLSEQERVFLLGHEVWHNALMHFQRQQDREQERWNVAADHEVNNVLVEVGLVMPEDGILFKRWRGQNAESVYERLADRAPVARPRHADVHLQPGSSTAISAPVSAEEFDAPEGSTAADAAKPQDPVLGPIQGKVDPAFRGQIDREAADCWPARIVAIQTQFGRGSLPGALQRLVDELLAPRVPWQTVLRDFVTKIAGGQVRWVPPARRHVHRGLYLPSRRAERLSLAVAIDTSGSTEPYAAQFVTELWAMLTAFSRYDLRLLLCDCEISSDQRFTDAEPPTLDDLSFSLGGTDFRPVFKRLAREPPTALIYLTDGFGEAPAESPAYPVLWVLTPGCTRPAPWGRSVMLDDDDDE